MIKKKSLRIKKSLTKKINNNCDLIYSIKSIYKVLQKKLTI